MIPSQIRLKSRHGSAPPATAWFLSGGDPWHWLSEICRWNVPQQNVRLYPVPRSRADPAPAGVLVTVSGGAAPDSPGGLAFTVAGGRLLIPVGSEITPPLSPEEIRSLAPYEVFFLHPTLGATGFDVSDARGVADLLEPPSCVEDGWDLALPGRQANTGIVSISVKPEYQVEELFGEESKEIGSQAPEELPPATVEKGGGPSPESWRKIQQAVAKAIAGALSHIPHTGTQRTWVNDVEDWAARWGASLTEELEKLRHKELNRLLEMLERDPEEGLRHALPLSQLEAHRGRSPPSARLGRREISFSLEGLLGGKPVDAWALSAAMRTDLIARYRAAALREMRLGRHRRAAYIYAKLLGDLFSAADALKAGIHFREAALLYRDQLRRPMEAAQCFEQARMLPEAIAIYEKEQRHCECARLYAQLGQGEKAREAWRRECDRRIRERDFLGAADVLEQELMDPEEAIHLLHDAWPETGQAAACLEAEIALMGRVSPPSRVEKRIEELRGEATPPRMIVPLAQVLASVGASHPDRAVRSAALDLGRVKIGQRLSAAPGDDIRALMRTLPRLAPEDRLLARDASRYVSRRSASVRRAPPVRTREGREPVVVFHFELSTSDRGAWAAAASCRDGLIVAGYSNGGIEIVRATWKGIWQSLRWDASEITSQQLKEGTRDQAVFLAVDSAELLDMILLDIPRVHRPPPRDFKPMGPFSAQATAGWPSWMASLYLAVAFDDNHRIWTLRAEENGVVLSNHQRAGRLVSNVLVPELKGLGALLTEEELPRARFRMIVQRGEVILAFGHRLLIFDGSMRLKQQLDFESLITGLCVAPKVFSPRVAVVMENQVAVCWLGGRAGLVQTIETRLENPRATFTLDGSLVIVTTTRGSVHEIASQKVESGPSFRLPGPPPIAVVPTSKLREFGTVAANGEVHRFQAPAR